MRGFQLLALVFALVGASEQPTSAGGKSLEDVYGSVQPVAAMDPWHARQTTRIGRPENYFKHRSNADCSFPLEIVILQDATRSFADDFPEMRDVQLPLMVDMLSELHPGTTFSVVTFRDKPIWSLGEPRTDYCQKFELPLTADKDELTAVYDKLQALGGGDPSENQFGALVALSQSQTVGWKNLEAAKLVVVATDAPPHFEGDGLNGYGMSVFNGNFNEAQAERQCTAEYYPSPAQVKKALEARELYAAFLVYDGEWWNSLPSESWKWFNSYLGQSEGFVRPLGGSSVDFWLQLDKIISEVAAIECAPNTTTAPPTTTTTTTTPPLLTVTLDGDTLLSTTAEVPDTTTTTTTTAAPATTTTTTAAPATTTTTTAAPETTTTTTAAPTTTTTTAAPTTTTTTAASTTTTTTAASTTTTATPTTTTTTAAPETTPTTTAVPETTPTTTAALETRPTTTAEVICPSLPPCVEKPCPPCEGECCHDVDIKLRHRPARLQLDVYN